MRSLFAGPGDGFLVLEVAPDGKPLTIPDAHFLFTAEYDRAGSDLILSDHAGKTIIVQGYFATPTPVDLASPMWRSMCQR
ncbi:MAG: hypothetical protein GY948_00040 [Alphaproteobacteria bacterium]|nr:hypothetical protein [Alphaproteobacteria bacterium]